ncbi:SPARC-related modular calcium-binding protein 1 isoform X2 [Contarinia nasturtii]|uniref:SPARC-related modular calcium-binding protein 1 isoform X2 n=1 Tax=Contarinia nasturtii TaxID=265458 RepID=UPI0012D3E468|nr:SPARC-related modular calcium-binding protein 1 isoform X2 [Contarinia nasturtii]
MLFLMCLISLLLPHSMSISISSSSSSSSSLLSSASTVQSTGTQTERTIHRFNCTSKEIECDESKARAVCGTDNQTYTTRCHLLRAQCAGHKASLKHRGPCKECLETRTYAIAHRSSSHKKFVPRCRSDGTYAAIQCMGGAGCWCSDGQGKPIPNTTTTSGKPICPKIGKVNIRRSPARTQSVNRTKNRSRVCRRNDQRLFNSNLLKSFYGEYSRAHPMENMPTDNIVLDWKFNQLDVNKDDKIHKLEFREMRRLVRKAVKPKRCARLFGKQLSCDSDFDEKLSRQEWLNCLTREKYIPDHNTSGLPGGDDYEESGEDEYDDDDDDDDHTNDRKTFPFFTPVTPYPPVYLLRSKTIVETDPVLREADTESDCLTDRAAALDEQKNGAQAYIPECTSDGRYQRIQCYRSVGYCWCVHEDTGKNIPGTSIKDGRPDCAINVSRPMKGCPEPRKLEFLKELKEFLRSQVATANSANATNWSSEDERVATLSFVLIDKNKNKIWERKEWKIFRELVTAASVLKKCGKKMPRYCDVNNDKRITLSEWLNCLQVQTNVHKSKTSDTNQQRPTQSALKLKGPNPLESYLKSD